MVIEHETPAFWQWLPWALVMWLLVCLVLVVAGGGLSIVFAIVSRGPRAGWRSVRQRLLEGTQDLFATSPRRIYALSMLAVQEALRRKVYIAFAIFVLIMLFAAWFLRPDGPQPAKLYLDFVLTSITYLTLAIALFLSCFSLPKDFSDYTIYTVVTKPVRPTEIVLGRIIGFTAIGSMMLLVMGLLSYFFVSRTLAHAHEIAGTDLTRTTLTSDRGDQDVFVGKTTAAQGHAHNFQIDIDRGRGETTDVVVDRSEQTTNDPTQRIVNDHWHRVTQGTPRRPRSGKITRCEPYDAQVPQGTPEDKKPQLRQIRVVSSGHGLANGDLVRVSGVHGTVEANSAWVVADVADDAFGLKQSRFNHAYEDGGEWTTIRYEVSDAVDFIRARIPVHAMELKFRDRNGQEAKEGINVGTEWEYRKHVEGETLSAARFRYRGMSRELFKKDLREVNGLRLHMSLSVFRTHKGDIVSGIPGSIQLINPKTGTKSRKIPFTAKEFQTMELKLDNVLPGTRDGQVVNDATIFDDYVADTLELEDGRTLDGVLDVELTCAARSQFLGAAKHDVYFLMDQANAGFNFMKGCLSIWLQMLLVTAFGVMFSTFLNGFVALLTTAAVVLFGYQFDFLRQILKSDNPGGLSFESLYRTLTRAPISVQMDPSVTTDVITWLDSGVWAFLRLISLTLPDMGMLSSVNYISQGFNVPFSTLCLQILMAFGFVLPLCLLGHYILKGREVAA